MDDPEINAASYEAAIDTFTRGCAERLGPHLAALYLGGSVARGDYVPGRSDIDLFVVLQERNQAAEQSVTALARQIDRQFFTTMLRYHPQPTSVAFTSLPEIEGGSSFLGVGFEREQFIETAHLLAGSELRDQIPETETDRANDIAQFGLNMLHSLAQAQEARGVDPDLGGFLFSPVFRAAAIGLSRQGLFVGGKQETVQVFAQEYADQGAMVSMLQRAYALWQVWAERDLTQDEADELAQLSQGFVAAAYALWTN